MGKKTLSIERETTYQRGYGKVNPGQGISYSDCLGVIKAKIPDLGRAILSKDFSCFKEMLFFIVLDSILLGKFQSIFSNSPSTLPLLPILQNSTQCIYALFSTRLFLISIYDQLSAILKIKKPKSYFWAHVYTSMYGSLYHHLSRKTLLFSICPSPPTNHSLTY